MTAIDDKAAALGGSAFTGRPLTPELTAPDGRGRFRHYERASLFYHPEHGAHEAHGAIRERWRQLAGEPLGELVDAPLEVGGLVGYPLGDEEATADGLARVSRFQGCAIYWRAATGAHEVHGAIRGLWEAELIAELGYPKTDESWVPGHTDDGLFARFNDFEHGSVVWMQSKGEVFEVHPPPVFTSDPALHGRWSTPWESAVVGVHAALLWTNEVLFWTYEDPGYHTHRPQSYGTWSLLSLVDGRTRRGGGSVERSPNLFCAGQCLLTDGRVLVGGGERETLRNQHALTSYEPRQGWAAHPELRLGRWYPTVAPLADGRAILVGGRNWGSVSLPNRTFQVFDPSTDTAGPDIPFDADFSKDHEETYPFVFALPRERLFVHLGTRTRILSSQRLDFGSATNLETNSSVSRTYGQQGSSVLLPLRPDASPPYRAHVMVVGGSGAQSPMIRTPATDSCEICDTEASPPAWRSAAPMHRGRVMCDSVLLPDGTVFVCSGSRAGKADNGADPVYEGEIYDPSTDSWTIVSPMTVPRLYHSTALLLPDARVLVAGSDLEWNLPPFDIPRTDVEVFSPPYLFRGTRPSFYGRLFRSRMTGRYGAQIKVWTARRRVVEAVLVRCGSATHSFNSDQRFIELTIESRLRIGLPLARAMLEALDRVGKAVREGLNRILPVPLRPSRPLPATPAPSPAPPIPPDRRVPGPRPTPTEDGVEVLTIRLPPDGHVAPPGYYMLFLLSSEGVPSRAHFLQLR